jgi:Tol biopolymer transport system component
MSHAPFRRGRLAALAAVAVAALVWAMPAQANVTPLASNGKIAFSSDRDAPLPPPVEILRTETDQCPTAQTAKQRSGVLLGFPGDCWFDIFTMNPDGTDVVNLTHDSSYDDDPSWSPDGRQIAFASMRDCEAGDTSCGTSIYVMDADGKNVRRLTDPSDTESSDSHPTWSPDGKQIAFQRLPALNLGSVLVPSNVRNAIPQQLQGFGIFVVPSSNDVASDGDNAAQLDTFGEFGDQFQGLAIDLLPAWAPDGPAMALTRVNLDIGIGTEKRAASITQLVDGDSGPAALTALNAALDPILLPDLGDLSFFVANGVVSASGGESAPLIAEIRDCSLSALLNGGDICQLDTDPIWRPDGKQIAFQRHLLGVEPESEALTYDVDVMTLDLASGDEHDLSSGDAEGCGLAAKTPQCAGDFKPAYSPDMTRIAFHSDRNDDACINSLGLIPTCDMDLFTMSATDGGSLSAPLAGDADGFVERNADWQPVFKAPVTPSTTPTQAAATPPPPVKVTTQAKPRIAVAGVRRACVARSFRVRVKVAHSAKLKYVRVYLDGRRILTTKKSKFTIRIKARKLKAGRHRLTTKAYDTAGNVTRSTRRIARCAKAKRKHRTGPRFTG